MIYNNGTVKKLLDFISKAKDFIAKKGGEFLNIALRQSNIIKKRTLKTFASLRNWWKESGYETTKNVFYALKTLVIAILVFIYKLVAAFLCFLKKTTKTMLGKMFKNKKKTLRYIGYSIFVVFIAATSLLIYYAKDLPSIDSANEIFVAESTKILDRSETTVLYDIYGKQKRTVIDFEEMPESIKNATIVAEDQDFYHHMGLDVEGILRAFWINVKGGEIKQGGSTITQQFIKNAFLTPKRTLSRKAKEAILALEMELKYSKDEILQFYLNQVPYGSNAYGVEAAAQTYFDKSAEELTVTESATLSALPRAPTYYLDNKEVLKTRRNDILQGMLNSGYITEEEFEKAKSKDIEIEQDVQTVQAPHFVTEVRKHLEQKYGTSFVKQAGLRVVTTLDPTIQKAAEDAVKERAEFNKQNFGAHNASIVSIDPHSGQILAMVGSKNFFGDPSPEGCITGKNCFFDPQVNVSVTPQQPGSSFKPFAYALAFKKGYTPNTILYDVPTEFNSECSSDAQDEGDDCYNPRNYDNLYFGPLPMKEALAQSRNVPSVKTLYLAGVKDTIEFAQSLGIQSLENSSRYGLSLVLGGGDVTLLEETSAFGVFAARGEKHTPTFVLRVEDKQGRVIEEYSPNPKNVIEKNIADQINYTLSNNEFRERAFGEENSLNIPGLSFAAKTGTTQNFRDAWTVGYTKSLAAGVWVGNNNNKPMHNAPGSKAAAPILKNFVNLAYDRKQKEENLEEKNNPFALPPKNQEDIFHKPNIPKTGKSVLDGNTRGAHSILYYVNKDNPQKEKPENPRSDPQYENWEMAVRSWAGKNFIQSDVLENTNESNIDINLRKPSKNSFNKNETINIAAEMSSSLPIKRTEIIVDDNTLDIKSYGQGTFTATVQGSIKASKLSNKNTHILNVEAVDKEGGKRSLDFVFKVE